MKLVFLFAVLMLITDSFRAPLQAQPALPWPSSQALVEEYQNLKLQTELYTAMDPEASAQIPELQELERRMRDKLGQIHAHSEELEKSAEGRALLGLSRKIQVVQGVRDRLNECYKSRKGKAATRAIVQALADQPEDCEPFASDSSLTRILAALAEPASNGPDQAAKQTELMNSLFYNTVLQSAQRYGELTYLVSDLNSQGADFFEQLCGSEAWCRRLAETQTLPSGASFKDHLNHQVQRQHQRMREQSIPRRTASEIGRLVQCELIGCGSSPGLYKKLDHNFERQLPLPSSELSFSLETLEQERATGLNLTGLTSLSSLNGLDPTDPDDLLAHLQIEENWALGVEEQVQGLIREHISALESDPVLKILGARTDVAAALCLGDCRAQVARSPATGAMELRLVNTQNLSPLRDDFLRQLHHRPETALKTVLNSTQDMLTEGLAAIGRELYPDTPLSPAKVQQNLGRLIAGNPLATAKTLLTRPEFASALCSAIEAMEDDNPWVDVLIVAGGVGAVAVGGIVAGPVGLTIASAAVGLGSAAYGYNQFQNHSAMARHYQVSCYNEIDPLSSETCRQYHQESVVAQMNLLGAGVDVVTLGSLSTYRRMVTQAITASAGLSRSLKSLRSLPNVLREVSEVVDESTARLFQESLAASSVAQREEFLSSFQRAKLYLRESDFRQHLKESVERACAQGTVR